MTLAEALNNSFEDNFTINYQNEPDWNDDGSGTPVMVWFDADYIIPTLAHRWGDRELVFDESKTIPQADLAISFRQFFNNQQQLYNNARMREALIADYNPLDNYNGKEVRLLSTVHTGQSGHDEHGSHRTSNVMRSSNYNHGVNKSTTLPDLTDKLQKAGMNTIGNPMVDEIRTRTGTNTDQGSHNDYSNNLDNGTSQHNWQEYHNDTDNYKHAERETITKGGNLGVTTSQQMLLSEIELRTSDWLIKWLEEWVNSITYYKSVREGFDGYLNW